MALFVLFLLLFAVIFLVWRLASGKLRAHEAAALGQVTTDHHDSARAGGTYTMHLVGEQFDNRQAAIAATAVGSAVSLVREFDNQFDPNAVAVKNSAGAMLGYLSRHNAEWVSRVMDDGGHIVARVHKIFTDTHNGITFNNLMIRAKLPDDDAPPLPIKAHVYLQEMQDLVADAQARKTRKAQQKRYEAVLDLGPAALQADGLTDDIKADIGRLMIIARAGLKNTDAAKVPSAVA